MITKAMANFLTLVQDGKIKYSQFTGAFGARYENVETYRKINHHDERTQLHKAINAGLITSPTRQQKVGGPLDLVLALTEAGKAALAERNA